MLSRRVLAYGFGLENNKGIYCDGCTLYLGNRVVRPFEPFDFIVLRSGSFAAIRPESEDWKSLQEDEKKDEMIRAEKYILNALLSGKIVCFLLSDTNDVLVERLLRLTRIGHAAVQGDNIITDILTKRSEFEPFLRNYGTAGVLFAKNVDDVICTAGEEVVGFSKYVKNGLMVFLPCHVPSFTGNEIIELLKTVSRSLLSYSSEHRYQPPNWVSKIGSPKEIELRNQIADHRKRIEELQSVLDEYSGLKTVLWLGSNLLEEAVRRLLNKMGLQTRKDEGYEEDFWITENGRELVISEVKGKSKNLQRQDISKLDQHRAAREKVDDFPALLVVNSFSGAESLEEKDIDISPAELRKATQVHVLIVRTIDLFNLYVLTEKGRMDQKMLLNLFTTEVGWLKSSVDNYEVRKI